MRIAIYPGTFDPITSGHSDIISRAVGLADKIIIAIAEDIPKTPIFSLKERAEMVENDISELGLSKNVKVMGFSGLLMDFAKKNKADFIIRGLRAVSDFEYEFQLAAMNARLNSEIPTIFLPASENHQFVASRMVKEVARLGGDVSPFVSPFVVKKLKKYYKK